MEELSHWPPPDPKTQPRITEFFHSSVQGPKTRKRALTEMMNSEAGPSQGSSDESQHGTSMPGKSKQKTSQPPKAVASQGSSSIKRGRPKKNPLPADESSQLDVPIEELPSEIIMETTIITSLHSPEGEQNEEEQTPSKKRRRSFTVEKKREVVEYAKKHSLYKAAVEYNLSCGTIGPWMKKDFSSMNTTSVRAHGSGRKLSYPQRFEPEIAQWILEKRDLQPSITTQEIIEYACTLIRKECADFRGTRGWFQKFLTRNNLLSPDSEPLSKKLPSPLEEKIAEFLESVKKIRAKNNFPPELIGNMDEVKVHINMASNRKADRSKTMVFPTYTVGEETQSYTLGAEKQHITVVLSALADGKVLPPMVIFKGVKSINKHIYFPSDWVICVQENGQLDSSLMELWIKEIWLKHTQSRGALLVMDCCHPYLTEDYTLPFTLANTIVCQIPPGCSSKLQPIPACIASPFKNTINKLCAKYYEAKLLALQNPGDRLRSPTKVEICPWLISAYINVAKMNVQVTKSFKATGLTLALDGSEDNMYRVDSKPELNVSGVDVEIKDVQDSTEGVMVQVSEQSEAQGREVALTELDNSLSSLKTLYTYMLQLQNKTLSETDMQLLEEQLQAQNQEL